MLGHMITFVKTDRHHSGVYTCTAENSEGSPAKGVINLEITCTFFVVVVVLFFVFPYWTICFVSKPPPRTNINFSFLFSYSAVKIMC